MAKKQHDQDTPKEETPEHVDEVSPELLAIESPDRDIAPSDVPEREDSTTEHLRVAAPAGRLRRFGAWFWRKKWLTIPGVLLLIVVVLLAIPATRYMATGWFWKEAIAVVVTDTASGKPVSEALVAVGGQSARTDKDGQVKFAAIAVGDQNIVVTKRYFKDASQAITVPWFAGGKVYTQALEATGRSIAVRVMHKITGGEVANVAISAGGERLAQTDSKGEARLVVPASKKELAVTLQADKFNSLDITIKQGETNAAQLTPNGRVFFLSKQSGKIDVVSTNLDGTDRKVVIEGTGKESSTGTQLLASRDWKYLVLTTTREAANRPGLYLIDTAKGSIETIDQGNIGIVPAGWSGHHFAYMIQRNDRPYEDAGVRIIKSYDAQAHKHTVIDDSQALTEGSGAKFYQMFTALGMLENGLVYGRQWMGGANSGQQVPGKSSEIVLATPGSTTKKVLKSYPAGERHFIYGKLAWPQGVYFQIAKSTGEDSVYAEYRNGTFKEGVSESNFEEQYPLYLMSPNGNTSFWSELRDGKYTLFTGGKDAQERQALAAASEYRAYGWYTDEYILLQKSDSELYITTPDRLKAGAAPLKIGDYHRAQDGYPGYGYGGL